MDLPMSLNVTSGGTKQLDDPIPLCAKSGHYAVQQSIALIGACNAEFSPAIGAGCKAPAHSHHILPLALSVLPHPARGKVTAMIGIDRIAGLALIWRVTS